ncbi:tachykinin family protein [Colletotrichum chrysophilum]|uniref:Tachykinin family protein n=2 Tax=Colletotrichum chrysophilum TaxID=1836956 RepID=A0AAD9ES54_9PEZI|nr:tachykinin family protein [Colletotrichum chrysophilum]
MQAPKTSSRRRQHHIRSRTGCSACKKRHVRCDEKRPTCTKCLVSGTSCVYLPLERWISETGDGSILNGSRPNFIGSVGRNAVWQLPKDPRTVDPFDSMPLYMSSKSHELFRYFLDVNSPKDGNTLRNKQTVGKVANNPDSFHGILLLAGLHYYWNNGNLGEFASTYYMHKINWIRSINSYLGGADHNDPSKFRTYLNIVGTIALIEMSMGDHDAARAHLIGLSMLKDKFQFLQQKSLTGSNMADTPSTSAISTDDTVQLYLALVTCDVIMGTSSSLQPPFPQEVTKRRQPKAPTGEEHNLPDGRLPLWLVTYFLMASYDISGENFDLTDLLDYLRLVTTAHGGCYTLPSLPVMPTLESQTDTQTPQTPSPFHTKIPWGSTVAAGGAYIHCIIGLPWTYGPSTGGGPLCYMIPAIQQDVAASETAMAGSRININGCTEGTRLGQVLWLWKVVVGACTVASAQKAGLPAPEPGGLGSEPYHQDVIPRAYRDDSPLCDDDDELYAMLAEWWARRLRRWSRATGVIEWNAARNVLALVAWPEKGPGERLAQRIWENAVNKRVTF